MNKKKDWILEDIHLRILSSTFITMTLNDSNGVIALILRFFSSTSIALEAHYVTVIADKPIMS